MEITYLYPIFKLALPYLLGIAAPLAILFGIEALKFIYRGFSLAFKEEIEMYEARKREMNFFKHHWN